MQLNAKALMEPITKQKLAWMEQAEEIVRIEKALRELLTESGPHR